jgi:hypothetical protein
LPPSLSLPFSLAPLSFASLLPFDLVLFALAPLSFASLLPLDLVLFALAPLSFASLLPFYLVLFALAPLSFASLLPSSSVRSQACFVQLHFWLFFCFREIKCVREKEDLDVDC